MADGLSQEPGQVNPSLLIGERRVLEMSLARGNVLRVQLGRRLADIRDVAVTDLTVDPDGTPVMHVSPATAEQSAARADEARRGGPPEPVT